MPDPQIRQPRVIHGYGACSPVRSKRYCIRNIPEYAGIVVEQIVTQRQANAVLQWEGRVVAAEKARLCMADTIRCMRTGEFQVIILKAESLFQRHIESGMTADAEVHHLTGEILNIIGNEDRVVADLICHAELEAERIDCPGIFAVMADMTDVDELITSIRRPGIVSSMATFIRKIASGFSVAIIGFMLTAVHYDEALANAGLEQAAATQHGIGICFVLAPAIMSALLLICAVLFPMTDKEFKLVQKDIARRKGEDSSVASEEEKAALKKVTGFSYENLWKKTNATLGK